MINSIHGIVSQKTTIAGTGGTSLPTQVINVNFVDNVGNANPLHWNRWDNEADSSKNLLNSNDVETGVNLIWRSEIGTGWDYEGQGLQVDGSGEFPSEALEIFMQRGYCDMNMRFVNLSSTKTYTLTFATVQAYNDPGDRTQVTINGQLLELEGPNVANIVYKASLTVVNPTDGIIDIRVQPSVKYNAGYGCLSAMILREFES